ncbi:transmembrane channel-like protein 7 isoform X2 [Chiloscyllium plagiosum]|uniref:transmembrane channel-like protein 7 isoform X2 n=1 Tax=Chiloscyllium plagiosum TaxID=36176 RepID=UPI001CB7C50A|nr:transmembrane channel-like protein 7 isoform X2 [Chiloscyllium plagiosum]
MEQVTVYSADIDSDQNSISCTSLQPDQETNMSREVPSYLAEGGGRRRKCTTSKSEQHSSVWCSGNEMSNLLSVFEEMQLSESRRPLRELPINLTEKRKVREKRKCDTGSLSNWGSWKQNRQNSLTRLKEEAIGVISWLELWRSSLSEIEGRYGTGIQSYFTFLRFLVFLNFSAFLLVGGFVLLPSIYINTMKLNLTTAEHLRNTSSLAPECFKYNPYPQGLVRFYAYILDLFSGTGFMELSYMFYGYYKSDVYQDVNYKLPLAYLLTMFLYFLLCFSWIIGRIVNGFKQECMHEKNYSTRHSTKIFTLWDFCIKETIMATLKKQSIVNDLKIDLQEQTCRRRKAERSTEDRLFLYFIRFVLNLFIMILLTGAFYCIYQATTTSQQFQRRGSENKEMYFVIEFFMEYLPPIVISISNILLPFLFRIIVRYEEYPPNTEINLILIRSVFLRLTNLSMLVFSLWQHITCSDSESKQDCEACGHSIHYPCWETKIGQEMYKLMLFDFLSCIAVTFCVELPRKFIVEHAPFEITKMLKKQQFLIPENVLDIVDGQTIVWIGMFYSPLLPLLNIVKYFIIFYVKKHSLYNYCRPGKRLFRASSSKIFFQLVLLFGLATAIVPVSVNIATVHPSMSCGPFRHYESAWLIIPATVSTFPSEVQRFLKYTISEPFILLVITILCMILTTLVSLVQINRSTITQLKKHLILTGKDKRYLVKKLSSRSQHLQHGPFRDSSSESDTLSRAGLEIFNNRTLSSSISVNSLFQENQHN